MQVAEGYKQTEVGVIPEDWELLKVKDLIARGLIDKPIDGNHGNIHPTSGDFTETGIPFVMANAVQKGRVNLERCACITKKQADSLQKGFSVEGDVLLTHKATIGNTAIVGSIETEYIMLTPQVTYYRVIDKCRLSNIYLRHFLDSSGFQNVLAIQAGGGTRSYIGIVAQQSLPIVLPPSLAEQEAIAEALSDADSLIESLQQLIAKKRQIKQGAMQELLQPKPEWVKKTVKEFADIKTGSKNTQDKISDGNYPFFVRSQKIESINSYAYDTEAVLTAGDGVGTGKVFHYINGKFDVHQRVYLITNFSQEVDGIYFHLFFSTHFYDRVMQMTAKSSVDSVRMEMIADMPIQLPPTVEEQTHIAKTLSDMDSEITALETKLTKAQQIKQGMMSELLTGKTRLI